MSTQAACNEERAQKRWEKGAPAWGFTVALFGILFRAVFFSVSRRIAGRTPFLLVFYPFILLIEKRGGNRAKNEENGKKSESG
jgi:hypothetical protein